MALTLPKYNWKTGNLEDESVKKTSKVNTTSKTKQPDNPYLTALGASAVAGGIDAVKWPAEIINNFNTRKNEKTYQEKLAKIKSSDLTNKQKQAATQMLGYLPTSPESFGNKAVSSVTDILNKATEKQEQKIKDANIDTSTLAGKAFTNVALPLVRSTPSILADIGIMAATGGTAAPMLAAEKAGTIAKAAGTVAKSLKTPVTQVRIGRYFSDTYDNSLKEGASDKEAFINALAYSIPSALIESSGGIDNVMKDVIAKNYKTKAGQFFSQNIVKSALEEGREEIAQNIVGNITEKSTYKEDMPLFSTDSEAIINPKQLGQAGLVGAIGGGLFGGAVGGVGAISNYNAGEKADITDPLQQVQEATTKTNKKMPALAEVEAAKQTNIKDKIVAFAQAVAKQPNVNANLELGKVNDRAITDIKNLLGIDVNGFVHNITNRAINHINRRHGATGSADHTMQDINDIVLVENVINNYDSVHVLPSKSSEYNNKNSSQASLVRYEMIMSNGTHYVVEAVPDTKAKKLQVVSAYIDTSTTNKKGAEQAPHAEALGTTSENGLAQTPLYDPIIAQANNEVNNIIPSVGENMSGQAEDIADESLPGFVKNNLLDQNVMTDKNPEEKNVIANVLTVNDVIKEGKNIKEVLSSANDVFRRKIIDSGYTINQFAKATGDNTLYGIYNNAKQAKKSAEMMIGSHSFDLMGRKTGESLSNVFLPVKQKGVEYEKAFYSYLLHMHNVDRMAQNKPVFGESVTAEVSQNQAAQLLNAYPEFKELAERVYAYNKNLMKWRVDSGLLSQEQADLMNQMYPHYVPTYRKLTSTKGAKQVFDSIMINQGVKSATGSNKDIMPIDQSIARQTMQTVQAAKRNILGNRLLDDALANKTEAAQFVNAIDETQEKYDIEETEINNKDNEKRNAFTFYRNGKTYTIKVNDGVASGLRDLAPVNTESFFVVNAIANFNNKFKQLVTSYNPLFLVTNFEKDIQDGLLMSKDAGAFIKTAPVAIKEMASEGELWQQYKALGGIGASFFDYDKGIKKQNNVLVRNTIGKVEDANMFIEQIPRFTEFMATINKGGTSYENVLLAMQNAADVTVNFGRSGTWGKNINKFVPFFNASVQGASKGVRRFTETKGAKQWINLIFKATVLGVLPSVINNLVYDDDDEYAIIDDRTKYTYYLFKVGNGKWFKIPKGRVLSIFGGLATNVINEAKNKDVQWGEYFNVAKDQVGPVSVAEGNIISPFLRVDLFDKESPGETWYGANIESQRLQNYAPSERYDERTDVASKWIGSKTGLSPKKINNIIDSYTGVVGDFLLPALTPQAERNPVETKFVLDSVTSNKLSGEFYDTLDELKYDRNSQNPTEGSDLTFSYMNTVASEISDLNKKIREIENDQSLTNKAKLARTRKTKQEINNLEQNALETYKKYMEVSAKYSNLKYDEAKVQTNKEVFGSEYALKKYDKGVYEKASKLSTKGVDYDEYYNAYFAQKNVQGDGTYLSASKRKKSAIDAANPGMSKTELRALYETFGVSEKVWY